MGLAGGKGKQGFDESSLYIVPQIRHLKMVGTRYGLRVAGLRGEDLKNSILKLPLKLFYLATRNAQHATSHTTST